MCVRGIENWAYQICCEKGSK